MVTRKESQCAARAENHSYQPGQESEASGNRLTKTGQVTCVPLRHTAISLLHEVTCRHAYNRVLKFFCGVEGQEVKGLGANNQTAAM